jgi:hypothetical protein
MNVEPRDHLNHNGDHDADPLLHRSRDQRACDLDLARRNPHPYRALASAAKTDPRTSTAMTRSKTSVVVSRNGCGGALLATKIKRPELLERCSDVPCDAVAGFDVAGETDGAVPDDRAVRRA